MIVGRCADAICRMPLSGFIYAGMDRRRERIAGLHPELEDQVEKRIISVDRKRKAYHEYYSTKDWGRWRVQPLFRTPAEPGVDGCLEAALAIWNM